MKAYSVPTQKSGDLIVKGLPELSYPKVIPERYEAKKGMILSPDFLQDFLSFEGLPIKPIDIVGKC